MSQPRGRDAMQTLWRKHRERVTMHRPFSVQTGAGGYPMTTVQRLLMTPLECTGLLIVLQCAVRGAYAYLYNGGTTMLWM